MDNRKVIYLDDAINALKGLALPLNKDTDCEDIWERDRTLDNAIDVLRGLPFDYDDFCSMGVRRVTGH